VNNGGEPTEIGERTLEYGLRAIRLYRALRETRDGAADVIAQQFLRAATSVGANVAEAKGAESEADFVHKYGLAQKEARESLYWLRLLQKAGTVSAERLDPLIVETDELVAIITSIIVRTKQRATTRPHGGDATQ
jgi:four helix bundle protein